MCSKASFIVDGNIAVCNNLVDNGVIIFILSDISILMSNVTYEHCASASGVTDAPGIDWPNLFLRSNQN